MFPQVRDINNSSSRVEKSGYGNREPTEEDSPYEIVNLQADVGHPVNENLVETQDVTGYSGATHTAHDSCEETQDGDPEEFNFQCSAAGNTQIKRPRFNRLFPDAANNNEEPRWRPLDVPVPDIEDGDMVDGANFVDSIASLEVLGGNPEGGSLSLMYHGLC